MKRGFMQKKMRQKKMRVDTDPLKTNQQDMRFRQVIEGAEADTPPVMKYKMK